jgi:hypothetical protein
MAEVQTLHSAVAYNAAAAALDGAAIQTLNYTTMLVWFTPASSYDGTATFKVSPDGGTTYFTIDGYLVSTIETPLNAVASPAATALYAVPVPANAWFRVVMSGGSQGALTTKALPTYFYR